MGLWQVLETDASEQNVANVKGLVTYATGKLILVRETFPDYTMHDRQHAENVVKLAEQLLGPSIGDLTPLEAAVLILVAYFHDIGMVYTPDELDALVEDEDFRNFLDENPTAYVRAHQGDEIPRNVVVQYCRARHADRVAEHLAQLDADVLAWDGIPISEALTTVCQSHMQPLETLRSERFPVAFMGSCDLRMCAILLRLADILDLDDTRSPAAVYDHLRLAEAADQTRMVSNTEWVKHMASRGFRFPPTERTPSFPLPFAASPRRPNVEHAIRKFLDVVEEELRGCRILLDFCDRRWQPLALPGSIDRTDIRGVGYRYGEYRFSLDRQAVLRLFMGDQLYSDPYVFIRELLQNAIDACRLNAYLHDAEASRMEVRVSAWEDGANNFWLRVDDNGAGMDRDIVEKYFLGVGRSYYRSDELEADILRKNKPQRKFVAISRFGIGVLSSFIVGDRIEVSTRRRLPDGKLAPALRLSLDSLDDFFVMQDQPMKPDPFPGRDGEEAGYRKASGTSVAVRIDPTKADVTLENLLETARKSLFFPPVRAFLNDVEQRGNGLHRLDTPLLQSVVRYPVQAKGRQPKPTQGVWATSDVSVIALPLDLTAYSPTPGIRGQLIAVAGEASGSSSFLPAIPAQLRRKLPSDLRRKLDACITGRHVTLSEDEKDETLIVEFRLACVRESLKDLHAWMEDEPDEARRGSDRKAIRNLADLLGGPTSPTSSFRTGNFRDYYHMPVKDIVGDLAGNIAGVDWLGHNGISVSTNMPVETHGIDSMLRLSSSGRVVIFGLVSLFDELRPDVSVSRDKLLGLPFNIRSALHLAIRRAASCYLDSPERGFAASVMRHEVLTRMGLGELTSAQVEADPLITRLNS